MRTLEELFEHQLKDLYSAEMQLAEALPNMAKKATDSGLQKAFDGHLTETKEHKSRLETICKELNISLNGEKCKSMESLIREAKYFITEDECDELNVAVLIHDTQPSIKTEI